MKSRAESGDERFTYGYQVVLQLCLDLVELGGRGLAQLAHCFFSSLGAVLYRLQAVVEVIRVLEQCSRRLACLLRAEHVGYTSTGFTR